MLRLMLGLDGGRHDLVEDGLHSVELGLTHELEDLGSFPLYGPPKAVVASTTFDAWRSISPAGFTMLAVGQAHVAEPGC